MLHSSRGFAVAAVLVALTLSLGPAADAAGPRYETSIPARMTHKLLRGVGNVFLGVVEIPKTIWEETQALDPLTGTLTGVVKGTGRTIARMGVGVYEVVTFPVPVPKRYEPIIEPEFVLMDIL